MEKKFLRDFGKTSKTPRILRVPPSPELLKKILRTKALVRTDARIEAFEAPDVLGFSTFNKLISRPIATRAHTLVAPIREIVPVKGERKALVLLVDFSDKQASRTVSDFNEMLFSKGTYTTRSLRDYYNEVSFKKLDISGLVSGGSDGASWYRAPNNYEYYAANQYGFGQYPENVQKLVEDVVQLAKPYVNFGDYDVDGDGYVDALFIVHAGSGAEETGSTNDLWSHKWNTVNPIRVDGVKVFNYSLEPEDGRIGVFCHELGHVFGLPDLYDYGYDSAGIGKWGIMAGGSWNDDGRTPAHFCVWSKMMLGWITPEIIFNDERNLTLQPAEKIADFYKLPVKEENSKEYFLIENRQKIGFDQHLPGEGLLVWHIDDNQANNNDQTHYLVALEQCDDKLDLESNRNSGDRLDPYPCNSNFTFDASSDPNSNSYDGTDSKVAIRDIKKTNGVINAKVFVGVARFVKVLEFYVEYVVGKSNYLWCKTDDGWKNMEITGSQVDTTLVLNMINASEIYIQYKGSIIERIRPIVRF